MVPVLLERRGPHGAAGAATAALFVSAVAGELLTPWLMSWWSAVRLMVAGQGLTAAASLVYLFSHAPTWLVLAATTARGFGMGVALVVCVALVAELAPPSRRGRSIAYFGLALSSPGIVFPSIGVWLLAAGHPDYAALIALLSSSVGALLTLSLRKLAAAKVRIATNPLVAFRLPGLLALFAGLVLVSCSYGGAITFAPIALPAGGAGSSAVFLLVAGTSRAASRWLAGNLGDHHPARSILVGGAVLAFLGLVGLAARVEPALLVCAAIAYGAGFGAVQTGAYLAMTERGSTSYWSAISALWNSSIDLGASFGGTLLGLSAAAFGYAAAVWVLPVVLLFSVPLFLLPAAQASARVRSE